MGYIKVVRAPHKCIKPLVAFAVLGGMSVGTQWQCDACQKVWTLTDGPGDWNWRQ